MGAHIIRQARGFGSRSATLAVQHRVPGPAQRLRDAAACRLEHDAAFWQTSSRRINSAAAPGRSRNRSHGWRCALRPRSCARASPRRAVTALRRRPSPRSARLHVGAFPCGWPGSALRREDWWFGAGRATEYRSVAASIRSI